jgi:hypothetical protein
MRQEGSDVDMPLGLPFIRCLSIVDDGYKLSELDVSLSTHTAPIREPRRTPIRQ